MADSNRYRLQGIRAGLIKGRIRTVGVLQPSIIIPPFLDALAEATQDDLVWALRFLVRSRAKDLTWRAQRAPGRINEVDAKLRRYMGG